MEIIDIVKKLIDKGYTISIAESITGGLIAKLITDVPGSSMILKESYVTYSNEAKVKILGIDNEIIERYGVVSEEVAKEMAIALRKLTNSDICVSTTGNAGPTVCDNKPVGRVYVGFSFSDKIKIDDIEPYIIERNIEVFGDESVEGSIRNRNHVREETAKVVFDEIMKVCQ